MRTKFKYGSAELERDFGRLTFGRYLRAHRLGEEWSQVWTAKKIGLSKQGLNDLERGRKLPSIKKALQIAKKLELPEHLIVMLVLQDQVDREKLNLKVTVQDRKKPA
jgi:DNA-binding XRE family transcriptional regulator